MALHKPEQSEKNDIIWNNEMFKDYFATHSRNKTRYVISVHMMPV